MVVWEADAPRQLPELVTVSWLRQLPETDFVETLRSNLLPPAGDPAGRRSWQMLWRLLADWPDLQEHARAALSGLLRAAEEHLRTNPEDQRAAAFQQHCAQRWDKLDPARLQRGGKNASRGEQLLAAIAVHRRVTLDSGTEVRAADVALWACLDPRRTPR